MKKVILFLLVLFFFSNIFSQKKTAFVLSNKLRTGYVINNYWGYDSFPSLKPIFINELFIGNKTLGNKSWNQFYNYPEVGFSIFTGTLGNQKQLGEIIGFAPTINFDVTKYKNFQIQLGLSLGAAYFTKPYDSITNPHNILVGSKFTVLAVANLEFHKLIKNNCYYFFGGSYIHASNGHTQVPNAGMNIASIYVGFKKIFSETDNKINQPKPEFNKKVKLYLNFGVGLHEFVGTLGPVGTPKYKIYSSTIYLGKAYKYWGKYFIGFSAKYYEAFNYTIKTENFYTKNIFLNSTVLTLEIAHEFMFGKVAIHVAGGLNFFMPFVTSYIYKNDLTFNINKITELLFSSKLGLKYYIFDPQVSKFNMFFGWNVKANFGNADYLELVTGFVF